MQCLQEFPNSHRCTCTFTGVFLQAFAPLVTGDRFWIPLTKSHSKLGNFFCQKNVFFDQCCHAAFLLLCILNIFGYGNEEMGSRIYLYLYLASPSSSGEGEVKKKKVWIGTVCHLLLLLPRSNNGWKKKKHLPNQQRTLNKLPTELRRRNFAYKQRLAIQIGTKCAKTLHEIPTELPFCVPPLVVGFFCAVCAPRSMNGLLLVFVLLFPPFPLLPSPLHLLPLNPLFLKGVFPPPPFLPLP